MSSEYNFYLMGKRYGQEQIVNLKEMAKKIEEKYGYDAKLEFEVGICSIIPSYGEIERNVTKKEAEYATTNFEKEGLINNSYLGSNGVGRQR